MNYLQQINGFWAKNETADLNSTDIAVYFALLNYCNRLNWLNPFVCHWDILIQYARCSKNSFYKSMTKLDEQGFIQYSKGERNKKLPKVVVLKFENNKGTEQEQQGNNKGTEREQVVEQQGNLYKHINNKTNIDREYFVENELRWFNAIAESHKLGTQKLFELFTKFWNDNYLGVDTPVELIDDRKKHFNRYVAKLKRDGNLNDLSTSQREKTRGIIH